MGLKGWFSKLRAEVKRARGTSEASLGLAVPRAATCQGTSGGRGMELSRYESGQTPTNDPGLKSSIEFAERELWCRRCGSKNFSDEGNILRCRDCSFYVFRETGEPVVQVGLSDAFRVVRAGFVFGQPGIVERDLWTGELVSSRPATRRDLPVPKPVKGFFRWR